jgi:hypothetical protein
MKKVGYKIRTHNCPMPNYQDIYGLELAEIKEKIYIFFAEYYYEKKNVQDLIKSGKIVPHNGSLSYSSDQLDWDWVNAQVGYAIKNKPVIPMPQSGGDFPPFVFLLDCINSLLDKGYRKIGELEYLPIINNMVVKIDNSCNPPIYCLHEGSVRSIIETLFTKLDSAYKELVDFCFPSLKNDLDYYSKLPHQFFIYWKDSSEQFDTFFNYAYKQSENGKTNFKWINTPFTRNDFDEYGYETLYSVRLDDLLEPYSSRKMLKGINTTKVDRHLVLRELVYKALTADFKKYCKKNGIDVSHNFS